MVEITVMTSPLKKDKPQPYYGWGFGKVFAVITLIFSYD
jgi:hypothetical protein